MLRIMHSAESLDRHFTSLGSRSWLQTLQYHLRMTACDSGVSDNSGGASSCCPWHVDPSSDPWASAPPTVAPLGRYFAEDTEGVATVKSDCSNVLVGIWETLPNVELSEAKEVNDLTLKHQDDPQIIAGLPKTSPIMYDLFSEGDPNEPSSDTVGAQIERLTSKVEL